MIWLGWSLGWVGDLALFYIWLCFTFGWVGDLVGLGWVEIQIWVGGAGQKIRLDWIFG